MPLDEALQDPRSAAAVAPSRTQVRGYVEEMVLELAQMASDCGETALAASLALVAIQAGSSRSVREERGEAG